MLCIHEGRVTLSYRGQSADLNSKECVDPATSGGKRNTNDVVLER